VIVEGNIYLEDVGADPEDLLGAFDDWAAMQQADKALVYANSPTLRAQIGDSPATSRSPNFDEAVLWSTVDRRWFESLLDVNEPLSDSEWDACGRAVAASIAVLVHRGNPGLAAVDLEWVNTDDLSGGSLSMVIDQELDVMTRVELSEQFMNELRKLNVHSLAGVTAEFEGAPPGGYRVGRAFLGCVNWKAQLDFTSDF
jgi:hypothetical protein